MGREENPLNLNLEQKDLGSGPGPATYCSLGLGFLCRKVIRVSKAQLQKYTHLPKESAFLLSMVTGKNRNNIFSRR